MLTKFWFFRLRWGQAHSFDGGRKGQSRRFGVTIDQIKDFTLCLADRPDIRETLKVSSNSVALASRETISALGSGCGRIKSLLKRTDRITSAIADGKVVGPEPAASASPHGCARGC